MKFARDCRSSESNEATAQLLFEALPWIKNLTGKTVVIKYGGPPWSMSNCAAM
ncbi:MAG: hypothetical protein ACLTYW_05600 [Collinsella sp.]